MYRLTAGLLLGVVLSSGGLPTHKSEKKPATLVEAQVLPHCAGLDCPPWPVPDNVDFCFQAGDTFYTGRYDALGMPWNKKGDILLDWVGKTMEIVVTDKHIMVTGSGIKVRLKRMHDEAGFRLASCNHA